MFFNNYISMDLHCSVTVTILREQFCFVEEWNLVTVLCFFVQNSNADASVLDDKIFRRLDELDAALRELEMDGRLLEERIRSGQYSSCLLYTSPSPRD